MFRQEKCVCVRVCVCVCMFSRGEGKEKRIVVKNNTQDLLRTQYVPGTVLSINSSNIPFPHFTDDKMEAKGDEFVPAHATSND